MPPGCQVRGDRDADTCSMLRPMAVIMLISSFSTCLRVLDAPLGLGAASAGMSDTTPVSGRRRTVRKWRYERSREDSRRSSTRARVSLFHANVHTQYHTRSFGV